MKRENTHQPDMDPSTKDVQKLQKGVKSILDDEIVFDDTADFKNNKEKIKLLAHALSSINECVSITDANNNLIFVNNAFVETYGFSREELIGNNIDDMVRGSNPLMDSTETIRAATIQGGWVGELVNKKKDGTEFPISLSTAVVHDDKNVPIALIGIASDITGRKKKEDQLRNSEESYRGLFNTILDAIYVLDKNGAFFDVNFGAEKMYGYKRNEFIGRTPEFLSAPGKNDFPKVVELIQNTFETGKSNSFEFWGLRKNGGIFPKIVTLHKGNYFGQDVIIAIARDITEQKQFELILKESEERYKSIFH
ncbi:MAG: PAS domain-containing protein, partial [Melioribacteraceae bacterium]